MNATAHTFKPGDRVEALRPFSRRGRGAVWVPATLLEISADETLGTSYLVSWANMQFFVDQVRVPEDPGETFCLYCGVSLLVEPNHSEDNCPECIDPRKLT